MTTTPVRDRGRIRAMGSRRRSRRITETGEPAPSPEVPVDLAPSDPALAYFQSADGPVDLDACKLDSPGIRALRQAGVKLVVPLVTRGELIGLLNLGARLSEQEYSADDRRLLESLAAQAAPALRVAQLVREQEAEVRRRERYEQELRVAQLIQQNFLPRQLPRLDGWSVDAFYRPAREVGGDFYDVIDLPDGRLGIVVGDVTDKGVPAALVMASTRSVLRASAQRLVDPSAVLERVNTQLVDDVPPAMFVTCLYGVLEPASGRFTFANAGHNLPVLRTREGQVTEPRATGMPLGLMAGMDYPVSVAVIEPGSTLLLYSDALPEAHAPDGSMYGFPRVRERVADGPDGGGLVDHLLDDLHGFTGPGWDQEDDVTLVVIRRGGRSRWLLSTSVDSEPGAERAVAEQVDAVTADLLTPVQRRNLATAVAEATMNAIEHGNGAVRSTPVDIEVTATDDAVVVRVADQGHAPLALPTGAPDLEAKLRGEAPPRGWGLFLMRSLVDDVAIVDGDEGHRVELTVRRREED